MSSCRATNAKLLRSWASSNLDRDLRDALAVIGRPSASANDLRRTFASWLRQAGVSNETIAHLMRHTTTAMVDRVYARDTDEAVEERLLATLGQRPAGFRVPAANTPHKTPHATNMPINDRSKKAAPSASSTGFWLSLSGFESLRPSSPGAIRGATPSASLRDQRDLARLRRRLNRRYPEPPTFGELLEAALGLGVAS